MRRLYAIACLAGCSFNPQGVPDEQPGDAAGPSFDVAIECPSTYDIDFEGHSYRTLGDSRTWDEANTECTSDGVGHLIKIDGATENDEILRRMNDENPFFGFELWIGLHDPNNTAVYQWYDGSLPTTFVNWEDPPDASNSDCAAIRSGDGNGHWFTRNCTQNSMIAVCECHGP